MPYDFFSVFSDLETSNTSFQESVSQLKVCVLGLGGLGGAVSQNLCGLGVNTLTIADDDEVALRNLHRQFLYGYADIGKRKVDVA
ncbi:ThiF family adenylyltransferase [Alicyclobacillus acidiphilus]|uniref:ThiF family adenylyltransferase n=1 Tax=Alicyclobacillus acidiphilus TaxID=182455 RepID=UPI00351F2785